MRFWADGRQLPLSVNHGADFAATTVIVSLLFHSFPQICMYPAKNSVLHEILASRAKPPDLETQIRQLREEEQCAAQGYRCALDYGLVPTRKEVLAQLLSDHDAASRRLALDVTAQTTPQEQPSAWSELTRALEVEAKLHARLSVLWTLRDGKFLLAREYQNLLESPGFRRTDAVWCKLTFSPWHESGCVSWRR
jgi:hypothetical protein